MSLPAYLANIKSSGIYRFVWDKSEIPNTDNEILRLVVGYSERGPFNTPVYIKSQTEFRSVFGDISKRLERQGCWFHRMALQALRKGPILCLNLKNFQNETVDSVYMATPQSEITENIKLAVKDIYNTNRFWTLEPELLEEIIGTYDDGTNSGVVSLSDKYITITAADSKDTSNTIFIRGCEPKGYDVTFKEWFASTLNGAEMPSYLEGYENRKLKNFWAEIYVFGGQFTNEIATSEALCRYFDVDSSGNVSLKPYVTNAFGEKKDTLDLLAANDASNFIRKYQGILLPEFQSATGSTISLDILFNNDNQLHKMMMRLNQNMLYDGIPVGTGADSHPFCVDDIDTMNWELADNLSIADSTDISYSAATKPVMSITDNIPVIYMAKYNKYLGSWDYGALKTNTANIDTNGMPADFYAYDMRGITTDPTITPGDDNYSFKIAGNGSGLGLGGYDEKPDIFDYVTYLGNTTTATGDSGKARITGTSVHNNDRYLDMTLSTSNSYWNGRKVHVLESDVLGSSFALNSTKIKVYNDDYSVITDPDTHTTDIYTTFNHSAGSSVDIKVYEVLNKAGINVGDILYIKEATDENGVSPRCTVTGMKVDTDSTTLIVSVDKDIHTATASDGTLASGLLVKCAGSVTATSINLKPSYVRGYEYAGSKVDQIPANRVSGASTDPQMKKNNWVEYQLGVLDLKGIRTGLTSRTDVDYRYLVDTFEAFAVPGECHAKLALIAKLKFNVLGLINFPNMKSFSKCKTMSFSDSNGFDSKYIAMGNNPMMASDGKFALASEDNGASFVSYNTPVYLKDPETGVKTAVPSAALVSNDFLEKYEKFLPYSIVAGPKRGRITDPTLVGPEFSFSREDLDNLEPMGVNCMVYVPGKGTYINSNQTAKQNPVSALSKIHIRELCTFLQDEIEKMMEYYHWDFNTPNLRQTLKDKADTICDTCYRNGGIYDYINVCDDSNNTPEIIDNEMVVLSTSIEPSRGAGKMVQELTLYRTGGLRAAIQDAQ